MISIQNLLKKKNLTGNSLKPKFRLGEFLAEKIIKAVAFLSFAVIILIFVFVFKEAPDLSGRKNQKNKLLFFNKLRR